MKLRSAATDLLQAGPPAAKFASAGVTVLLAAVWSSLTSILAVGMVLFFAADMLLGVLKAVHCGGLGAFDQAKFARAWTKLGAAAVGIVLFTAADLLLHEAGSPEQWMPLTTVTLTAMCWGFFWSALQSFAYFFPEVGSRIEGLLNRGRNGVPVPESEMRAQLEERRGADPFRPRTPEPPKRANGTD